MMEEGLMPNFSRLAEDGSFVYTPDPDFHGEDSFTYIANDGLLSSSPATVTINLAVPPPVPPPPPPPPP